MSHFGVILMLVPFIEMSKELFSLLALIAVLSGVKCVDSEPEVEDNNSDLPQSEEIQDPSVKFNGDGDDAPSWTTPNGKQEFILPDWAPSVKLKDNRNDAPSWEQSNERKQFMPPFWAAPPPNWGKSDERQQVVLPAWAPSSKLKQEDRRRFADRKEAELWRPLNKGLDAISTYTDGRFKSDYTRFCRKLAIHAFSQLNVESMSFRYIKPSESLIYPIKKSSRLWQHPKFEKNNTLVIFCTGWNNSPKESNALSTLKQAFLSRKDVNFVVLDVAPYLRTLFDWAALSIEPIARLIAKSLSYVPSHVKSIHLIGHSIGAHIMGHVGREFNSRYGLKLARITGLDPARPCVQHDHSRLLRRTDAQLVDVIHSNINVLGIGEPVGHFDFYPGGLKSPQPGCVKIGCSHARAVDYFAQSVYWAQERSLLGYRCNTWQDLEKGKCSTYGSIPMGYGVTNDTSRPGVFLVKVNRKPPYGASKNINSNSGEIVINIFNKRESLL